MADKVKTFELLQNVYEQVDNERKATRVKDTEENVNITPYTKGATYFWHKQEQQRNKQAVTPEGDSIWAKEGVKQKGSAKPEILPDTDPEIAKLATQIVTEGDRTGYYANIHEDEFAWTNKGKIYGENNMPMWLKNASRFYQSLQEHSLLFSQAFPEGGKELWYEKLGRAIQDPNVTLEDIAQPEKQFSFTGTAGISESDEGGLWANLGAGFGLFSDIAVTEMLYEATGINTLLKPTSGKSSDVSIKVAKRLLKDKSEKTQVFWANQFTTLTQSGVYGAEAGAFSFGMNYYGEGEVDPKEVMLTSALGFAAPFALPVVLTKTFGGISKASKSVKGAVARGIYETGMNFKDLDVVNASPKEIRKLAQVAYENIAKHIDEADVDDIVRSNLKKELALVKDYLSDGKTTDEVIELLTAQTSGRGGRSTPIVLPTKTGVKIGDSIFGAKPMFPEDEKVLKTALDKAATIQRDLSSSSRPFRDKVNLLLADIEKVANSRPDGMLRPQESINLLRKIDADLAGDSSLWKDRKSLRNINEAIETGDVKKLKTAVKKARGHKGMADTVESDKLLNQHKDNHANKTRVASLDGDEEMVKGKIGIDGFEPVFDVMRNVRSNAFDRENIQLLLENYNPTRIKKVLAKTGHTLGDEHPLNVVLSGITDDVDDLAVNAAKLTKEEIAERTNGIARRINGLEESAFQTQAYANRLIDDALSKSGSVGIEATKKVGRHTKITQPRLAAGQRIYTSMSKLFGTNSKMARLAAKLQMVATETEGYMTKKVSEIYSDFADANMITRSEKNYLSKKIKVKSPVTGKTFKITPEESMSLRNTLADSHVRDSVRSGKLKRITLDSSGTIIDGDDLRKYLDALENLEGGLKGKSIEETLSSIHGTETYKILSMGLEDDVLDDIGLSVLGALDDSIEIGTEELAAKYGKDVARRVRALGLSKKSGKGLWRPVRDFFDPHTQEATQQMFGTWQDRFEDMYPTHAVIKRGTSKAAPVTTSAFKSYWQPRTGLPSELIVKPFFSEVQSFSRSGSNLAAYGVDGHRLKVALQDPDIVSHVKQKGLGDIYQNAMNIVDYINAGTVGSNTLMPPWAHKLSTLQARVGLYGRASAALAQHGSFSNAFAVLDPKYADAEVHSTMYFGNKALYQDLMDDMPSVYKRGQGRFSLATNTASGEYDLFSVAHHGSSDPTAWGQHVIVNRDKGTITSLYQAARKQVADEFGLSFQATKGHYRVKELMSQAMLFQPNWNLSAMSTISINTTKNPVARMALMFMSPTISMMDALSMARHRWTTGEITGADYGRTIACYVAGLVHTRMMKQTTDNITNMLARGITKGSDKFDIDKALGVTPMPEEMDSPEEVYKKIADFTATSATELIPYFGRFATSAYDMIKWNRGIQGSPFNPLVQPVKDTYDLVMSLHDHMSTGEEVGDELRAVLDDFKAEELTKVLDELEDKEVRASYVKYAETLARVSDVGLMAGVNGVLDTIFGGLRTPETDAANMVGLMDGAENNYNGMTAMKIDAIHAVPFHLGKHKAMKDIEKFKNNLQDAVRWQGADIAGKDATEAILAAGLTQRHNVPLDKISPDIPLNYSGKDRPAVNTKNETLLDRWDRLSDEYKEAETDAQKLVGAYRLYIMKDDIETKVGKFESVLLEWASRFHNADNRIDALKAERNVAKTLDILFEQFPPSTLDKYAE